MSDGAVRPRLPERTCIGCRRKGGPAGLVRFARRPDGILAVGRGEPGRGAWLCAGSEACFEAAVRRRAFSRALRSDVPGHELAWLRERLLNEVASTSNGPMGRKLDGVGGA
jgi:predicted RNA-binding protein YlxR (DUF448 family)